MFSKQKRLKEILIPKHAGLLIIDLQRDFLSSDGMSATKSTKKLQNMQKVIPKIDRLHELFKERSLPVIWTQTFEDPKYRSTADLDRYIWLEEGKLSHVMCLEHSKGSELIENPGSGEAIIKKHNVSAYVNTNLSQLISINNISTLYIVGVKTNRCVMRTIQDLHENETSLHVVPVEDCIATDDPLQHKATMNELKKFYPPVINSKEIIQAWSEHQGR